jgi:hypothetical protein
MVFRSVTKKIVLFGLEIILEPAGEVGRVIEFECLITYNSFVIDHVLWVLIDQ